jgi:serine/threonine protein kinase
MGTQFELYKESEENSIFVTDKSALYDDSQMGDNLSDFEVLRELGSFNGHNTISKVRSLKNGKIYAMKHIELKRIGNEQEKDLCNKGMEKLIALKHPHLLSYYKTFKNNDDLYLIYEYMDNDDLNSFIKGYQTLDEKVDEEIIWNYLLQCLSGLSYLHINNLAYLAIKPTNIFLNNEQKLKIGLFYDTPKLTDKYYNIKDDIRFIGLYFYKMCFSQYVKNSKWIDDFNINKNIQNKFYSKNLIDIIFLMLEEDVNKRMSSKELYSIVKDIYVKNFTNNTSIEALLRCLNSFPAFTNEILQLEKKFTEDQKKYLISYWFTKTLSGLNSGGDLNVFLEKFRNVLASENSKLDGSKEVNPIYLLAFLFEKMHNEGNEKKRLK